MISEEELAAWDKTVGSPTSVVSQLTAEVRRLREENERLVKGWSASEENCRVISEGLNTEIAQWSRFALAYQEKYNDELKEGERLREMEATDSAWWWDLTRYANTNDLVVLKRLIALGKAVEAMSEDSNLNSLGNGWSHQVIYADGGAMTYFGKTPLEALQAAGAEE